MPSSENHNLNPILIMYIFFLKYVDPDSMETNEKAKTFSTKSLKDEHGNYPVWMSMRRVQKQQKKNKAVASAAKSAKKKAHNGKFGKVTKKKNLK